MTLETIVEAIRARRAGGCCIECGQLLHLRQTVHCFACNREHRYNGSRTSQACLICLARAVFDPGATPVLTFMLNGVALKNS